MVDRAPSDGGNSSLQSITRGASLHFVGKVISNGLGFLLNLLLTRGLGAALYGIYAYALTLISFAVIFSRLGTGKAILRFLPAYEDNSCRRNQILGLAYLTALVGSTVAGIVLYIVAPLVSEYTLDNPLLVNVIRIFAIILPFKALIELTNAVFRGLERMELQVFTNDIVRPLVKILLVSIALVVGYSLQGVVVALATASILVAVVALSILLTRTSLRPDLINRQSKKHVVEFYNFSVPLTMKDVGQYLYKRVDILMVGFFLLEADVGVYQVALLIAGLLTLPLNAFNQLFPPVASRLHSNGNVQELNSVYKRVTRWTLTLSIPPALVALLYSRELLSVFGPEFPTGAIVLILFVIAQLTNCAVGPSGFVLMMTEHQYLNMLNQWLLGILNVILNYVLILEFGLIGAALATAGVLAFINVVRLVEVWYTERLFPYSLQYWKPLLAGILSGIFMYTLSIPFDAYVLLVIGTVAGFLVYGVLLYSFGIENEDREFLRTILAAE